MRQQNPVKRTLITTTIAFSLAVLAWTLDDNSGKKSAKKLDPVSREAAELTFRIGR